MKKGTKCKESILEDCDSKGSPGNAHYKYKMGVTPIATFAKHRQTALKERDFNGFQTIIKFN